MGLLIKGLLGALVVVLIGVLAKTKNYAIAGLVPLFPTFALIAHYIVAKRAGDRSPARDHRIRHVVDSSLFYLSAVTVVFHRDHRLPLALAGAVGCWGLCAWLLILGWSRFH